MFKQFFERFQHVSKFCQQYQPKIFSVKNDLEFEIIKFALFLLTISIENKSKVLYMLTCQESNVKEHKYIIIQKNCSLICQMHVDGV